MKPRMTLPAPRHAKAMMKRSKLLRKLAFERHSKLPKLNASDEVSSTVERLTRNDSTAEQLRSASATVLGVTLLRLAANSAVKFLYTKRLIILPNTIMDVGSTAPLAAAAKKPISINTQSNHLAKLNCREEMQLIPLDM